MIKAISLSVAAAVTLGISATSAAPLPSAPIERDAASPAAHLIFGVDTAKDAGLQKAQWFYGGRRYCFYDYGWRGGGYYRCGYANRRGFGWGGVLGWNGWGRYYGGYRGGYYRGYRGGYHGYRGGYHGYHGGNYGYHGGGYHGGGFHGGGYHGGGFHGGGGHGGGGHHGGGDHHH